MAGENAEDADLTEAVDKFKIEEDKRFNSIAQQLNNVCFFNPREPLQYKATRPKAYWRRSWFFCSFL